MSKFLRGLGFIIGWGGSFLVVYLNHVVFVEATFDVDMFGLLLVLVLLVSVVKSIDKRVEVWDIQDRHNIFILNWKNIKKILLAGILTWVMYTIEDDLTKIQWSGVLITTCFIIGWLLTLWGTILKKKSVE